MSVNQSTFYKYAVMPAFSVLKVIKRKEYGFKKYIKSVHKRHIMLDQTVLINELDLLIKQLENYTPEHVLIINEKAQFEPILSIFTKLTGFKLVKYTIGMFSNITTSQFINAVCIVSFHDRRDRAAILEAKKLKIKNIGISNLSRGYIHFDRYIPVNNFQEKSIALVTWYVLAGLQELRNTPIINFEEYFTLVYGTTLPVDSVPL